MTYLDDVRQAMRLGATDRETERRLESLLAAAARVAAWPDHVDPDPYEWRALAEAWRRLSE